MIFYRRKHEKSHIANKQKATQRSADGLCVYPGGEKSLGGTQSLTE
ncbi:hypothetical protein ECDEC7C_5084 [Escherichia coli DEC7C]|nr:hypothetical protein ECDEC7C_5084 [Escherichia coli DEC7C]